MQMPSFFDDVPRLRVRDPLAQMLGSAQDGVFEYGYGDVLRLTGHSCPTVAAAYWLTWLALRALYPHALPERGGIRVEFRDNARVGSTGVTATVVQMLTGAAGSSGFKGLVGRFSRAGLQRFAPEIPLSLRFTRLERTLIDIVVRPVYAGGVQEVAKAAQMGAIENDGAARVMCILPAAEDGGVEAPFVGVVVLAREREAENLCEAHAQAWGWRRRRRQRGLRLGGEAAPWHRTALCFRRQRAGNQCQEKGAGLPWPAARRRRTPRR